MSCRTVMPRLSSGTDGKNSPSVSRVLSRPCSSSFSTVASVIGLVIEPMSKPVSSVMGSLAARSRHP